MRRRVLIPVVLLASVLLLGASPPTVVEQPKSIDGLIVFHGPWAGGMDLFIDFDVSAAIPNFHDVEKILGIVENIVNR